MDGPKSGNPAEFKQKSQGRSTFMLVLNRKRGEVIVIANNVTVTVLGVQGGRVKLGLTAPSEMPIHREETLAKLTHCRLVDVCATAEVA
jgi:carbon storage regulator